MIRPYNGFITAAKTTSVSDAAQNHREKYQDSKIDRLNDEIYRLKR